MRVWKPLVIQKSFLFPQWYPKCIVKLRSLFMPDSNFRKIFVLGELVFQKTFLVQHRSINSDTTGTPHPHWIDKDWVTMKAFL